MVSNTPLGGKGFVHPQDQLGRRATAVIRIGAVQPLLYFTGTFAPLGHTRISLGPGSLWVAASLLGDTADPQLYAGLRITSGLLEASGSVVSTPPDFRISAPTQMVLRVVPAPNAEGSPASVPATATFTFPPGPRASVQADTATIAQSGATVTLTRSQDAAFAGPAGLVIPFTADASALPAIDSRVATFSGSSISRGGWSLLTSHIGADGIAFDAGSGGAIALNLEGLFVTWDGLQKEALELKDSWLGAGNSTTTLAATVGQTGGAFVQVPAWTDTNESDPGITLLQLFTWTAESLEFRHSRTGGSDLLQANGVVSAEIPKLKSADGKPLRIHEPSASLHIADNPLGRNLTLGWGRPPDAPPRGKMAIAAANALLTTTLPSEITVSGTPGQNLQLADAFVELKFGIYQLLPTLPDPYAANFEPIDERRRDAVTGTLRMFVKWTAVEPPSVEISIPLQDPPRFLQVFVPAPQGAPSDPDTSLWRTFLSHIGTQPEKPRRLLDISGASDQWGVCLGQPSQVPAGQVPLSFDGPMMQTLGYNLHLFALPQVSWEAITNIPNPKLLPFPDRAYSPNDGDRAQIGVSTVTLVPVQPVMAARQLLTAQHKEQANAAAFFTLPFGLQAVAEFGGGGPLGLWLAQPSITFQQIRFGAKTSASQIRMQPGRGLVFGAALLTPPVLPGATVQNLNLNRSDLGPIPPVSALGVPTEGFFNSAFQPGAPHAQVPVSRVDLSGYGESCFSTWTDEVTPPPAVTQVRLDVINGRTSREVVQVKSILWPCQAILVRTITFERRGNARVLRWDSGWVATTPGLFTIAGSANRFHKGLVRGLYEIRNIRDTPLKIPTASGDVQAVYFDADADIENVVQGANAAGRVPALNQLGFVQLVEGAVMTPAILADLLDNHGPVGGTVDCTVDLGASGQRFRAGGLYSETASAPDFAVPLYGMPVFTGAKSWSLVRSTNGGAEMGEVRPVNPQVGVPVIRANGGDSYRIADSADLLNEAHPFTDYGLLYSSHTHRALFGRPKIKPGDRAIHGDVPPLVSDPYSMLNAVGLFPRSTACLPADAANYLLDVIPEGLKMPAPIKLKQIADRKLANSGSWAMRAAYTSGEMLLNIDPTAPVDIANPATWPVQMPGVAMLLNVPGLDDLLQVVNNVPDLGDLKSQLPDPEIIVGPVLNDLRDILSVLSQMGLPGGLDLSLAGSGLENQIYHLRVTGRLRLGTKDGDRVDVGMGKLSGELTIGVDLSANPTGKSSGKISFGIGGDLQVGILPPLLYGGGLLKFAISINDSGDVDWQFDAGVVASIGGDLVPGLVSLEATVHYAYLLHADLRPGVRIGMDARAEVLDGLLGVKFGVDAEVSVSRPGGVGFDVVLLDGSVTAMGEVTAAWVFDEDFSKTFQFRQELPLRYVAFAAISPVLVV